MHDWLATIAADPIGPVALVLVVALVVDMMFVRLSPASDYLARLGSSERREATDAQRAAAEALYKLDFRAVAQAVEDTIIEREHLVRILGTRALDLWIEISPEDRADGPWLQTRAKIVAFEPVALDEERIAQCARMIKRRVSEELTELLGFDADEYVNGGVTIETAIERTA